MHCICIYRDRYRDLPSDAPVDQKKQMPTTAALQRMWPNLCGKCGKGRGEAACAPHMVHALSSAPEGRCTAWEGSTCGPGPNIKQKTEAMFSGKMQ